MKFEREDNGNCRVYYRGQSRTLYCYQEDRPAQFTFYRCSRDGEPSYEVEAIPVPPPPGDTQTGRSLIQFLERGVPA